MPNFELLIIKALRKGPTHQEVTCWGSGLQQDGRFGFWGVCDES